jgi:hypothetical protein
MYVNGVLDDASGINKTGTRTATGGTVSIGNRGALDRNYDGFQDEFCIWNRVMTAAEISADAAGSPPPSSGLLLYYKMDEASGTSLTDSSGSSLAGTISGASYTTTDVPFKERTAASNRAATQDMKASLRLDGSSAYATIPHSSNWNTSTFTISVWVKRIKTPTVVFGRFFQKRNSGGTQGFGFFSNTGGTSEANCSPFWEATGSGGNGSVSDTYLPRNEWRHYVLTFDGTNVGMYANGVAKTPGTITGTHTPANSDNLIFNTNQVAGGGNYGSFQYKSIRFINRVVTPSEAVALYNSSFTGATGDYPAQEGAGTVLYDTSGNANNGTITSGIYTSDVPAKKRALVGANLVYNGDFEFAPPSATNVPTTGTTVFIDGSAAGSSTSGIFGWGVNRVNTNASAGFDYTTSHSGSCSMKLSTLNSSGRVRVFPMMRAFGALTAADIPSLVPALPNTSYTLTGWIKTNNVTTNGAYMQLIQVNGNNLSTATVTSTALLTGTNDWTFVTATVTTGSGTRYIAPNLGLDVAGNVSDAWFDDIVITPTTNTVRSLVS